MKDKERIMFEDQVTIRDKYGPAMEITGQEEANIYFEACVEHGIRHGRTRQEAEDIERSNLGYYAGYYNNETMERVNKLFDTTHPIFGDKSPTAEEAFETGVKMAKAAAAESRDT